MPAEQQSYDSVSADYFARRGLPGLKRPYRSSLGIAGALITLMVAIVTLVFQLLDPVFAAGVFWVGVWFGWA